MIAIVGRSISFFFQYFHLFGILLCLFAYVDVSILLRLWTLYYFPFLFFSPFYFDSVVTSVCWSRVRIFVFTWIMIHKIALIKPKKTLMANKIQTNRYTVSKFIWQVFFLVCNFVFVSFRSRFTFNLRFI